MNIKQFFHKFTGMLNGKPVLTDQSVHGLISMLENTRTNEISCGEVFALVDEYAEANQRGEDVDKFMPLLRHHLDMCQECVDEYEALVQVLEGTVSQ